jgi:hypothetical protein
MNMNHTNIPKRANERKWFHLPLNGLVFKSNPEKLHITIRNGHKSIKHRNNRLWTYEHKT